MHNVQCVLAYAELHASIADCCTPSVVSDLQSVAHMLMSGTAFEVKIGCLACHTPHFMVASHGMVNATAIFQHCM